MSKYRDVNIVVVFHDFYIECMNIQDYPIVMLYFIQHYM